MTSPVPLRIPSTLTGMRQPKSCVNHAGGWRVTAPTRCPRIPRLSCGSSRTCAPRVARDTPRPAASPSTAAGGVARRHGRCTPPSIFAAAPSFAIELHGTPCRTPAAASPLTAPGGTISDTPCIASLALASSSRREGRPHVGLQPNPWPVAARHLPGPHRAHRGGSRTRPLPSVAPALDWITGPSRGGSRSRRR